MTTPNTSDAGQQALAFVDQELEAAQRTQHKTRITMTVVVLFVVAYAVGMTAWLSHNVLRPTPAADIATARVVDIVQQGGATLSDQVVREVPAAVAALPDMMLEQLPHYRVQLEDKFEHSLTDYGREFQPEVEAFLDQFLAENQEHVQLILSAAQDPKLTKHFGDQLEHELLSYLNTPNEHGESVMDTLDQGRSALENVETRLHRLAHATDLTPDELKLRRVIASTMKAADIKL